ncbi:MAG: CBS domain-containing protein [Anaerolineales bacterium]|nr:CBS domain-containing protein [Anaerolineales bacterium]
MQIIATHENSDFDAIASLLAAHKLFPDATPVLPRRINRNVRSFLTVYWDALPFTRPEDLGRKVRIDQVILVDTQGLVSLKGMQRDVQVWVIDHHPPSSNLDPNWRFEGEQIGAATTLLLERFMDRGIRLTPIEATLLLLGIYEDTGSMTYDATTSRDLRAAAWLLEQRADLGVMMRFLYHPLTAEQRVLYERLQQSAEVHRFDGQSVMVAAANAIDYSDEISTLAHKMRDLYDPDALFILVQLEYHIQLVARSTIDSIDVGQVASYFGGGGHSRAAAAIIREKSLDDATAELLRALPDFVRPAITVEQIMSHGVKTVSPDTPIKKVHELALRLGYEGYPVVKDGRIIGLLTRRAIDRAMQHKLDNVTVNRFMQPGDVSVRPGNSVSTLQRLMMEHGWGQIPVVGDENNEVIGVVTRTDVIKLWQPRPISEERERMKERINHFLPPLMLELVIKIGQIAEDMGVRIYFVGGLVRDILLDIPNKDLDIVSEGDAITLANRLVKQFGGRVRTHARFGTAKWILSPGFWKQFGDNGENGRLLPDSVDFVTARSEFYKHPTALPQVSQGSIKLDLHRRDFTINTLAVRLNPDRFGELLDFYGGKRDIDSGLIRVLHSLSFIDDPTRILRAVRFEQRLNFKIEPRTEELLLQSVPLLDRVTGDRIRHELELLLHENRPELGLDRLDDLGVLAHIHPDLNCDDWFMDRCVLLRQAIVDPLWELDQGDYLTEFAYFGLMTCRMDLQAVEVLEKRLKVRRTTADNIKLLHVLVGEFNRLLTAKAPSEVYVILENYSNSALMIAYVAAEDKRIKDGIFNYVSGWKKVKTCTTGADLLEAGLPPGPRYRDILNQLLYARLDGKIKDDREERLFLKGLL